MPSAAAWGAGRQPRHAGSAAATPSRRIPADPPRGASTPA